MEDDLANEEIDMGNGMRGKVLPKMVVGLDRFAQVQQSDLFNLSQKKQRAIKAALKKASHWTIETECCLRQKIENDCAQLAAAGIDLPFPTQVVLFHDQTEATDGDRRRQREGWPAGNSPPEPRPLNRIELMRPEADSGSNDQR